MSEYLTVARPYAQAVFDLAREGADFKGWSDLLQLLAVIAEDPQIQELAQSPRVSDEQLLQLIQGLCGDSLFDNATNFLSLLVQNHRVSALPSIAEQYEQMRAEAEGTIDAELISAMSVTDEQRDRIAKSLSQRLGREVNLNVSENPDLIGGAVLRAGDLVIDASVKGRLEKLAASLTR